MNPVVCKCLCDPEKYCKNWDGKGDVHQVEKDMQCPKNTRECQFLVTPKPSPMLKAS